MIDHDSLRGDSWRRLLEESWRSLGGVLEELRK